MTLTEISPGLWAWSFPELNLSGERHGTQQEVAKHLQKYFDRRIEKAKRSIPTYHDKDSDPEQYRRSAARGVVASKGRTMRKIIKASCGK